MLIWVIFALMTVAVLLVLLAPLSRPAGSQNTADAGSLEVYRDQLSELDAEQKRGVLDAAEAEATKLEISRRLLTRAASSGRAGKASLPAASPTHKGLAIAAAAFVTLATLGLYLLHGTPDLPSFPVAGRKAGPLANASITELVAKVEARLRAEPQDGDGWDVIAPVYFKLERFGDAAKAYARASALKGESAKRLAGLAEASVLAADGVVTEEARVASQKILKIEPGEPQARFWLALAREQDGKLAEAVADYQTLLAFAPADAPWRGTVEARIAQIKQRLAGGDKNVARGPTAEDAAAAQKLTQEQRAQMITAMVDGLAQRLARDGKDLAGWVRLVNAYVVLGRDGEARKALASARQQLAGDRKAEAELAALSKRLGFGS